MGAIYEKDQKSYDDDCKKFSYSSDLVQFTLNNETEMIEIQVVCIVIKRVLATITELDRYWKFKG